MPDHPPDLDPPGRTRPARTRRVPAVTDSLPTAVDAGLQCLRNLALVDAVIAAGDVEHRLRTALSTGSHPDEHGRAAARIACAHLAAGALTDAHFALLTAHDQLLSKPPDGDARPPRDHHRVVDERARSTQRPRATRY